MKRLKIYAAGAFIAILGISCNKDDDSSSANNDNELLRTSSVIDQITENDFQAGMATATQFGAMRIASDVAPCANVTSTPAGTFPRTFTIDFGAGCTHNGITRSGILTVTLSGPMMQSGSQMTLTRENYYVNGYHVEGTVTYVNQTSGAIPQWTRTVTGAQITTPAGLVFTHSGQRTVKMIEGAGTPTLGDNVFEITAGQHTVTRPNGTTMTSTITTPLIKRHSCLYISQGVVHLEGTYVVGDLDYGNDECDNLAVFTNANGESHTVNL